MFNSACDICATGSFRASSTTDKMYFCKLGFLGASVLLGCWAVVQASPASLGAQRENLLAAKAAPSDNDASIQERTFIQIAPEPCTSASGRAGICRSSYDCAKRREQSDGRCALFNLGVCCVGASTTQTCNARTSSQETTFTNRNYPSAQNAAAGSCPITVSAGSNTCQLRLDMTEFSLAQPNSEGVCATSYLTVTGGSTVPRICGENAGQHLYVDVTSGTDVVLDVISQSVDEKWSIKVTQIPCNSADRAPTGCLQYFTTTSGTISSFNYDSSTTTGGNHLSDQSYGVCIMPQSGYCSITYSQTSGSDFSLTFDPNSFPPTAPGPPLVNGDCTTDYIIIPGATITDSSNIVGTPTTADRFCGLAFPGATSSIQPYNLNFVSNSLEITDGDIDNKGFQLDYTLNRCP
ncbi:CUB domain [Trinorchestia longiramus]|nr:CUB domain [Trinorchestia longiramus]